MMYNPMQLTGKRILVTGASSGIGRACSIILARLGAELILLGRNQNRLHETKEALEGDRHQIVVFDLEKVEKIKSLPSIINSRERNLSGVVHAAGIWAVAPLAATSHSVMLNSLNINFLSFVEIVRVFSKKFHFTENGGCFVAISSIAGSVGYIGGSAYCSTKASLDSFARVVALELAPKKIRVNTIVPGFIKTPMSNDLNGFVDFSEEKINKLQPLGMGHPDDVANATAFLLSDAAKLITGTKLVVDGGYLAQ